MLLMPGIGRRGYGFVPLFSKLFNKPRSNESSTANYYDFHDCLSLSIEAFCRLPVSLGRQNSLQVRDIAFWLILQTFTREPPAHACSTIHAMEETARYDLGTFFDVRPRLFGIAYRMLGSAAEAEDLVQDVWMRWQSTDRKAVQNATRLPGYDHDTISG